MGQQNKSLQKKVEKQLSVLIGKPLWGVGRAGDLEWFHFGGHYTVKDYKRGFKEVGDYALHVQCPWRICLKKKIVVASSDRFYPKDRTAKIPLNFKWDKQGINLCDFGIESFVEKHCPVKVKSIIVDSVGGFKLLLESGFCLDVFPDSSRNCEHWRLFEPACHTPHVVLEGNNLRGILATEKRGS